jgi:tRNA (adenine22-N1)-methyltransferase
MLPPRLAAIAELIPEGSVVADVGGGHGRLAAHLVVSGRSARVILVDRSREELAASVRRPGLSLRLGDGLTPLRPEDAVDTVVVAGLGGAAIVGILAGRPAGLPISRYVLQPQTEAAVLRSRLPACGLALVDERLVEDAGRFYVVIGAVPGTGAWPTSFPGLTPEDVLAAGPCLLTRRPPELAAAWERQRVRLARIGRRGGADDALARAERILAYLATSAPGG